MNEFKKTLRKLLFDILNSEDDLYWYAHLNEKGKISQKCQKINSCLLVSTFSIYLFNSFSFSLLSSPHPYYGFYFIYL